VFYWLVKYTLRPLFLLLFRPRVVGAERIPARGGALLASNHLSMCDSLFLPVLTRRRVTFLAKSEYFTGRGIKGRAKAAFVRGTGLLPIERGNSDAAAAALAAGVRVLRTGRLLGVYPEGSRSPDGRLYRGKTGVVRMALLAQVPVVPVAMVGTDKVLPIGETVPRRTRVEIRIGEPLDFSVHAGRADDPTVLRALTDDVMLAIGRLSGQERTAADAALARRAALPRLGRAARTEVTQPVD